MNKTALQRACVAGSLLVFLAGGCSPAGTNTTTTNTSNTTTTNATDATTANVSFASPQPSPGASPEGTPPPTLAEEKRADSAQSMVTGDATDKPDPAVSDGTAPPSPGSQIISAAEQDFVKKALEGGATEVELGKLAETQGTKPAIKEFGKGMVEDHTAAGGELKTLARQFGVEDPGPKSADVGKLASLKGAQFDAEYAKMMVADHERTVALFKSEATNGVEPTLKKWAQTKLPTLEHHLEMARKL